MKVIDNLLLKARAMRTTRVFFYFDSECKFCNKHMEECICKNDNDKSINFIRVKSREEAKEWLERKEKT